jgi:hypothetical protein
MGGISNRLNGLGPVLLPLNPTGIPIFDNPLFEKEIGVTQAITG